MLFAYFGPETMMPMTSVLAVVAGVFMMLGRQAFTFARLGLRKLGRMVGLVKTPEPPRAVKPASARNQRLDQAEAPIHGAHASEAASPKASEWDQAP